jgi:ATP-dependent helicase/nuclease subunit B
MKSDKILILSKLIRGINMSLQYILGCSGSGKTHYLYDLVIKESMKDTDKPLIIIVPEQFTLETQKDIVNLHPSSGIMQIEVLSFQRLAYRIFDEIGGGNKTLLGNTGKGMIIRKVIEDNKDKLAVFHKNCEKSGFIKELKSIITEFYQYDISPEDIDKSLQDLDNKPLLQNKLNDLQVVFNGFKEYIKEKYITTEETLDLLSYSISQSKLLKDAIIYIDGFYGFTPIQYKVIREIVKKTKKTYITMTIDKLNKINDLSDESELFYESKKTINKLSNIAKEEKIKINSYIFLNEEIPIRYRNNKSLAHLEHNIFRYPYKVYEDDIEGIYVHSAPDTRKEVEYLSNNIIRLVKNRGYRYGEIAVVTGDLEGYEKLISQSFREFNIPFFIDKKKDILSHPLVEFIRAALEIINKGFTYESIFRYLKTSLTGIDINDIDVIENYVLAYGIRGRKNWENSFEFPYICNNDNEEYVNDILQKINVTREKIIQPLIKFYKEVGSKKIEVRKISMALYNLLCDCDIENQIYSLSEKFRLDNQLLLEKEYKSIYKLIMELIDKIVEILGNEKLTLKEYTLILESGLEQCEMGLVPPGLDQIVVGDLERSRLREIKALFIMGLNEGKVPKTSTKANILSDSDKQKLLEKGIELAPDNKMKVFEEQFLIYAGFTKPSNELYLSFARTDLDGKSMRPSILISRIKKIFKHLTIIDLESSNSNEEISLMKPTFKRLLGELREYYDKGLSDYWKDIYTWYYTDELWKEHTLSAVEGLYHINKEELLSRDLVRSLYSDTLINSVSRLEAFAKCPFAHFLDYGLNVNERIVRELSMPDIGILFHRSIDEFSKKLSSRELDWSTIEDNVRDRIVEETVIQVAEKFSNNIFYSSSRNTYLIKRLTRITKRAIWALQYHIIQGEFKPTDYEVAFSADKSDLKTLKIDFDDSRSMKLKGRIDRVDKYETEDTVYVKVIDYKSGNKKFDITALYYGLQLQLLVYLNAVTELESKKTTKKVIPAGVFYYHIDDPIIKQDSEIDYSVLEKHILKSLKMNGLVLEDIEVINKMDKDINGYSDILPVQITTKGAIGKRSSVASYNRFNSLKEYVHKKTEEIGKEIMRGNIDIYPYKNSKDHACQYCNYLSICQFDESTVDNDYRKLPDICKEQLWKNIES